MLGNKFKMYVADIFVKNYSDYTSRQEQGS